MTEDYTPSPKNVLVAASVAVISPYIIPTVVRSIIETSQELRDKPYRKFTMGDHIGYTSGLFAGLYLDVLQVIGYSIAVEHDHPEVLAIPILTNIVSALYERNRSRRAKSTVRGDNNTLDAVVEDKKR